MNTHSEDIQSDLSHFNEYVNEFILKNKRNFMNHLQNEEHNHNLVQKFLFSEITELHEFTMNLIRVHSNSPKIFNSLEAIYDEVLDVTNNVQHLKNKNIKKIIQKINTVRMKIIDKNQEINQQISQSLSKNMGAVLSKPSNYSQNIQIEYKETKIPNTIKVINWVNQNLGKIFAWGLISICTIWLLTSISGSVKESRILSNEQENLQTIANPILNVYKMMESEFFTQKTFRNYVILTERANKENSVDNQWNIKFNDSERVMIFTKNDLSKNQCKTLVALKEISFDASSVNVNGMNLPQNFWTASDDAKWTQPINQELCALNNNTVQVVLSSPHIKQENRRINGMTDANFNFYIQQHQIAKRYDNSEIINKALNGKINFFQSALDKRKNDVKA